MKAVSLTFVLLFLAHRPALAQLPDPHPDPRAVVVEGNARFTILTPQVIRMEWNAEKKFETGHLCSS